MDNAVAIPVGGYLGPLLAEVAASTNLHQNSPVAEFKGHGVDHETPHASYIAISSLDEYCWESAQKYINEWLSVRKILSAVGRK